MRAKISDERARWARDVDIIMHHRFHVDRVREYALAAEDELREILTEAEPADPHASGHYSPCDGYRYMEGCWVASPKDGNAQAALAESLAAFVGE